MEWIYIKIIYICTIYTIVQECTAFTTMNMDIYVCQNGYIPPSKCFHEFSVMHVRSVSLQFKDSAVNVSDRSTRCHREVKVQRKIINILDQALTPQYRYIYRWARHKCQGRRECLPGRLPRWDQIQGDGTAEGKYFSGIRVDAACDTIPVPTEEAPISTTTTSTTTTARAAAISFYILTPQLTHIERIMLGVSLGLSISILLVTLLLLYHWDTMRRKKRLLEILDDIGRPHEEHDWYVDELVEEQKYSQMDSIKPDEIMTLDRISLLCTKQVISEDNLSVYSHNFCATISRNNSVRSNGSRGSGWRSSGRRSNRGYTNDAFSSLLDTIDATRSGGLQIPSITISAPMDYTTEENVDLERRMAETLGYHTLDEKSVTHDTLTSDTGALTDNIDGLTSFIDASPSNTEAPINNTEVETETSNEEGDSSRNTSETESLYQPTECMEELIEPKLYKSTDTAIFSTNNNTITSITEITLAPRIWRVEARFNTATKKKVPISNIQTKVHVIQPTYYRCDLIQDTQQNMTLELDKY